jgi:hypothetical protein
MTTSTDPEDGTLVQREGVDAGSARSTAEGPLLTGGTSTGRPADRPEHQGDDGTGDDAGGADQSSPVTQPAQVWATDSGVADPDAAYATESGQDEGSID